jgi:hypothetical protein
MLAKGYSASRATKENTGTMSQYDNNLVQIETLHLSMRPLLKLQKALAAAGTGAGGIGKGKGKKKAQVCTVIIDSSDLLLL